MHSAIGFRILQNSIWEGTLGGKCFKLSAREPMEGTWIESLHKGICDSQICSKELASKAMRNGYYWPTMIEDSINLVKNCTECQIHANKHHILMLEYHTFGTSILFVQWELTSWVPIPKHFQEKNYLVVAIDHFTRWIKVKALASITARKLKDFFFEDVVCWFGIQNFILKSS